MLVVCCVLLSYRPYGAGFFPMDDLTQRIETMRSSALERTQAKREADLAKRKAQWTAIQEADPDLADLMTELRRAGMDFKPVYVLVKHDQPTTKPGTYRIRVAGGIHEVTVPPGFQRV